MPVAKVTKVTVSQVWDDNSSTDLQISKRCMDTSGLHVALSTDGETVNIYPESWPEIRDQIESMMDEIHLERGDQK